VPNVPLFELLCYSLVERFAAPVCPHVPAVSKCVPSLSLARIDAPLARERKADAERWGGILCSMVKIEEYMPGITLVKLLEGDEGLHLRSVMNVNDWYSVIV